MPHFREPHIRSIAKEEGALYGEIGKGNHEGEMTEKKVEREQQC